MSNKPSTGDDKLKAELEEQVEQLRAELSVARADAERWHRRNLVLEERLQRVRDAAGR